MQKKLSDIHKQLLLGVLQGSFPPLKILRHQAAYFREKSRPMVGESTYLVEFCVDNRRANAVVGLYANIAIQDTILYIHECNEALYVRLDALDGYVRWLSIQGGYDFSFEFTIRDIGWMVWNNDPKKSFRVVFSPSNRDFEGAIGFHLSD